jgi:hypothetical protein
MSELQEAIMDVNYSTMSRFNDWPREKRSEAFYRHNRLMERVMQQTKLQTICTDCESIMPTAITPRPCSQCGSVNTCSPYYC